MYRIKRIIFYKTPVKITYTLEYLKDRKRVIHCITY